jgi:PQQ-dependent dehydrogenase (methanol/ethanol family)
MPQPFAACLAALVFALPAVASAQAKASPEHIRAVTARVDGGSIQANAATTRDWPSYGLDYAETRFSRLKQIDTGNVKDLGLVWSYDLESNRGVEATPVVIDGIMYVTASWSVVHAVDVRSGKRLWTFDPKVNKADGYKGCCDVVNRGVAVWKGKVFVAAYDGRLFALDAATGSKAWEVDTIVDRKFSYTVTGAPRVYKGKVIIGNGGAEYGVRGYITAYDADTGKQRWRWFTVPGDPSKPFEDASMAKAAKTWDPAGKWWEAGGGGTAWDTMAFDPKLNLMYVGTGNGSPWARSKRSPAGGDNLYLASIVALNPDTGKYVWHYQQTPGDNWDFTSTQPMILADMKIGGKERQVILHAPKNGFFFVIDRKSGQFISAQNFVEVNWATGRPPARDHPQPVRRPQLAPDVVQPRHRPGLHAGAGRAGEHARQQGLEVQRRAPGRAAQRRGLEPGGLRQRGAAQEQAFRPPGGLGPGAAEGTLGRRARVAVEWRHAHHRRQPRVPGHGRRALCGLRRA